jgi:hypothetical protein
MSRTSHPTNVVIRIKGYPLFSIFLVDELHTIIANKNRRCSPYEKKQFDGLRLGDLLGRKEIKHLDEHMFA